MAPLVRLLGICTIVFSGAFATLAQGAAPPPQVLNVDLEPRIRSAALHPERFAVDVPNTTSIATDGTWLRANGWSTWQHSLRIPTAVSMGFHADGFVLPEGATLKVTAGGSQAFYRQTDAGSSGLWSRVQRGDTLAFEIRVPTAREADVVFRLASLQAGYRGLGGGVPDHPVFRKLHAASASAAACTENFACHENAGNFGPRNATAAIVIGGVAQCTATLINNVRGDTTRYLLTARHCQVSTVSASSVSVYWDAAVPCEAALATIYDTLTPVYLGGGTRTVVEQQDIWLIEFGPEIAASRVYYAGWDATGGTFVGAYSPHHALGRSRQYTGWYGQAVLHEIASSALGSGYRGNFWGVVNQVGNVGSGASGGGLFNPDNRLVGTGSLAQVTGGSSGEGVCPVNSPPAPTTANAVAEYNAFSAVWDSTADTTSTTNPVTLKSVLDPDNTGTKVVDGFEWLKGAYVSAETYNTFSGYPLRLTWNAPGATGCVAEGGLPGDGWSGDLGTSGSRQVTEEEGGAITYAMRCTDGTRKTYVKAVVTWTQLPAQVHLFYNPGSDGIIGSSKLFSWRSNVKPCVATGGVAGDGWAGPKDPIGEQEVVLGAIGPATYTITCGSGTRVASSSHTTNTQPPVAYLLSIGLIDNLRVGQSLRLAASGLPNCVRSGGSAGDDWSTSTGAETNVTATVPGTYTYTLTCSGGGQSASASVTATFNDDAPFVNLVPPPPTAEVAPSGPVADNSHGAGVELRWTSNLPLCELRYTGPGTLGGKLGFNQLTNNDYWRVREQVVGSYTYTVTCTGAGESASASATIDWFTTQPMIHIYVPPTVVANQAFPVRWESNLFPCTGGQGSPGDNWAGPKADAQGQSGVILNAPGTYTYDITCGSGPQIVRAEATTSVPAPVVTVTPHNARLAVLYANTIDWSASVGPCVLSSDPFNPSWTGTQFASGRAFVSQQVAGTYTYTATCGPPGAQVTGSAQVIFDPSPFATVNFRADRTVVNVNEPVVLTWSTTNTDYCSASANTMVNDWNGAAGTSGSKTVTRPIPGTVIYRLSCNGASMAEVSIEVRGAIGAPNPFEPPAVALTTSHTQRLTGQAITLAWNSTRASQCSALGGGGGANGWGGPLALSSSQNVIETVPGNYTYFVVCEGAPPSAQASVTVSFLAPAPSSSSGSSSSGGGSGGGGGGGRIDWLLLLLLAPFPLAQLAGARRGVHTAN